MRWGSRSGYALKTTRIQDIGTGGWVERDVLINGRPADQLGTIALAIVVPILYLTPLVWLVYRYLVRPAHENR